MEPECGSCAIEPSALDSAASWTLYDGVARDLIHLLKYRGVLPAAHWLGEQLVALPAANVDVVVPVPLARGRRRERGYNQSEELARVYARQLGLRCAPRYLQRERDTRSQTGLNFSARRRNVQGAFRVPRAQAVRGLRLLLIDDVLTTGATAQACARACRRAGAAEVHLLTVARAELKSGLRPSDQTSMERPAPTPAGKEAA